MKKLTKSQADTIEAWLNNWQQLKGTAIPLRFREQFARKQKERFVFSKATLTNGLEAEILRIDGGLMRKATKRCNGDNSAMGFVLMEYAVLVNGRPLGNKGVDELDVMDVSKLLEVIGFQMVSPLN